MHAFVDCFAVNKGLTLSSFVLQAMLGAVAEQANRLLEMVHGGRYRLSIREGGVQNKLDGLELSVQDAYSGGERAVRTLSGGEKFLVSLALSLGLSSVVRAQAGGVRMEAMFIDEGFGTLDRARFRMHWTCSPASAAAGRWASSPMWTRCVKPSLKASR